MKDYKHASYFLSHMECMIKCTEKTYNSAYKIIYIVFDALKKKEDIFKLRLVMTSFWNLLWVCVYHMPTNQANLWISRLVGEKKVGQASCLARYS